MPGVVAAIRSTKFRLLLQFELGPLALRDFARDGLKSGDLLALEHQLHVLAHPALMAMPVDDREFVIGVLLLAPELAQVKALRVPALVLPDQFQVRAADHLRLG